MCSGAQFLGLPEFQKTIFWVCGQKILVWMMSYPNHIFLMNLFHWAIYKHDNFIRKKYKNFFFFFCASYLSWEKKIIFYFQGILCLCFLCGEKPIADMLANYSWPKPFPISLMVLLVRDLAWITGQGPLYHPTHHGRHVNCCLLAPVKSWSHHNPSPVWPGAVPRHVTYQVRQLAVLGKLKN